MSEQRSDVYPTIWPAAWRSGQRVGVISTSSRTAYRLPHRTSRAANALQACLEASAVHIPELSVASGFTAGEPQEIAAVLHAMLTEPSIGLIISAIGGFNTNAVLEHIDWELIRCNPKPICGYSDTSSLLNAIHTLTGVCTFHGPALLPQWGDVNGPVVDTRDRLLEMLVADQEVVELTYRRGWSDPRTDWSNDNESVHLKAIHDQPWRTLSEGRANGTLVGGNIETLNMLIGTPYQPRFDAAILFVEATGAEAYLPRFARALTHLRSSGCLDRLSGLVVGRCPDAQPVDGVELDDVVRRVTRGLALPIAVDVDLGHTEPLITLPIGGEAVLDATSDRVSLKILVPARAPQT